jgi:hypothetical protein
VWIGAPFERPPMTSAPEQRMRFGMETGGDVQVEPAVLAGEYLRGTPQASALAKSGSPQASAFSMIPEAVLVDSRLQHIDIRVYGILACARRGNIVALGQRRMAERLHVKRRTLTRAIARLIEFEHLKLAMPMKSGMRARYELTSALFVATAAAKSDPGKRDRRSKLSPTVRMARAFAANQAEREREIA